MKKGEIPIRNASSEFLAEARDSNFNERGSKRRGFLQGSLAALAGITILMGSSLYAPSRQNETSPFEQITPQRQGFVQEERPAPIYNTLEQQLPETQVSQRGIEFIKQFEDFSPVIYDPIPNDGIDEPTIGYGHLVKPGEKFDEPITRAEAEVLLMKDIAIHEEPIREHVTTRLNQNQYDALASFIYNLGETNFRESTLLKKLNNGNYQGAADEFPKWKYSNGKALRGLKTRRLQEREMFLEQ